MDRESNGAEYERHWVGRKDETRPAGPPPPRKTIGMTLEGTTELIELVEAGVRRLDARLSPVMFGVSSQTEKAPKAVRPREESVREWLEELNTKLASVVDLLTAMLERVEV